MIIIPMSLSTALVLVEDTMEEEQMGMRTKKIWRKTILEPDDESGVKQMLLYPCAHANDVRKSTFHFAK